AIAVPLASVRRRAGRPAAVSREWHTEQLEQRERLLVGSRARGDRDVESPDLIDLVVVDLREDDLLLDAHVVVAAAVEGARRQAAEVADPRDRYRQQAVEELVGALAAQRDADADGHPFAQLERGDRLARSADARLLPGDAGELRRRLLQHSGVGLRVADAHVHRDLLDLRRLHRGGVAEALDQGRADLVQVCGFQSCRHGLQSMAVPERRAMRKRLPSRTSMPTRVGLLSLGSSSITFEMWIGPSRSITPATASGRPGVGRWCRLTMLRPSTKTFCLAGSMRRTRPLFPRSFPAITTTSSSLRIRAGTRAPPG